jgi:hypothetical protein
MTIRADETDDYVINLICRILTRPVNLQRTFYRRVLNALLRCSCLSENFLLVCMKWRRSQHMSIVCSNRCPTERLFIQVTSFSSRRLSFANCMRCGVRRHGGPTLLLLSPVSCQCIKRMNAENAMCPLFRSKLTRE